ncbi:hypothetical protein [Mesorhizobium loti]|uniref:hypothetical protein n=1 Tax=Rhizobium loti TaxID=381 RepID=UPI000405168C|nr:hypothetical protein [Mesorhizobium loti]
MTRLKQNGPPFSGPFVFDVEPISWPVQEPARVPELAPGQEPELAPGQEPEPELAQEPVLEPVWRASSVLPVRALGPVCWPPAALQVPDVGRFCRKRSMRLQPG